FRVERFTFRGSDYGIPRPSFESELMMETYLENRALEKLTRRRMQIGEEAFRVALSVWEKDCAASEYGYGSLTLDTAIKNGPGFREWLYILLRQNEHEVSPELIRQMMEEIPE